MALKKEFKDGNERDFTALRQLVSELENKLQNQTEMEREKAAVEHSLRERVKELNCLYGVAEVIELNGSSFEKILQGVVNLIPPSWQYPEITTSRIIFEGREFFTTGFKSSEWRQTADIYVENEKLGVIEVFYLEEKHEIDEGPFLQEERLLIDAVAERLGRAYEKSKLTHFLRERVKELSCLYETSRMIEAHGRSLDKIGQGIVDFLPGSWQYPGITHGRIICDGKEYVSLDFQMSAWSQTAPIKVGDEVIGSVEVYYIKEMPEFDEGPFLREERLLIDAVAGHIGRAVQRIRMEQQLDVERVALEEKNIALREIILKVREEEKAMGDRVHANVDRIIMPIIYALENTASSGQMAYLKLLGKNMDEITSPFTNHLSRGFIRLSPVEVQICSQIKAGLTTKEIAQLRKISPATVSRHREHIRKKLDITNEKINLATYLQTLAE